VEITVHELRGLAAQWRDVKAEEKRVAEKIDRLKKELTKALGDQEAIPIVISDKERYVLKRVERDNRKPDLKKLAWIANSKDISGEWFDITLSEENAAQLLSLGKLTREDYEATLTGKAFSYVEMRLQEIEADDGTL
jgi:transcriptional regulator with XRE-family HTH domain